MRVLIKNAKILSSSSPFHGQSTDILVDNGVISKIGNQPGATYDQLIKTDGLTISLGWMDCFANFCDPGHEYKETLESGARAAAAGGFTQVMLLPNTQPVVHNKSQVEYIMQKSLHLPVRLLPIGAITKNAEGIALAEMYDMFNTGAVAFSDGIHPVQSSGMLQKALQYLLAIDATIIQLPDNENIGKNGLMNEGIISTRLGLQGKPSIGEELLISGNIELARYTGSKIHFTGVSTRKALELIAAAKKEKVNVTCSVTPYHLFFCDEDMMTYDTNLKVNPPLRTAADRDALREGVTNGIVDFIASHHQPQNWDQKVCEFEYARNGMEGIESVFAAARTCGISTRRFVEMQTDHIRNIFNLPTSLIKEKEKANLTLFAPDEDSVFEEADVFSKCKNNAFIGKLLKGRVIGIINEEKVFLSESLDLIK